MLPVVYDRRMAGNSRVLAPASGAFVLAQSASGPALKSHNRGMRGLEEAQEDYVVWAPTTTPACRVRVFP